MKRVYEYKRMPHELTMGDMEAIARRHGVDESKVYDILGDVIRRCANIKRVKE